MNTHRCRTIDSGTMPVLGVVQNEVYYWRRKREAIAEQEVPLLQPAEICCIAALEECKIDVESHTQCP